MFVVKRIFIFALFFCSLALGAQHNDAYLDGQLHNSIESGSFESLLDTLENRMVDETDLVRTYLNRLATHGEIEGLHHLKSKAYGKLAKIDIIQGRYKESISKFEKSLEAAIASGDKQKIASSYSNYGTGLTYVGEYAKALDGYELAISYCQEIGDIRKEAICYQNIGFLYMRSLNNSVEAERYFRLAIDLCRDLDETESKSSIYFNLGVLSIGEDAFEKAAAYLDSALMVADAYDRKMIETVTLYAKSEIAIQNDQLDEAEEILHQASKAVKEINNGQYEGEIHLQQGTLARKRGQYELALHHDSLAYNFLADSPISQNFYEAAVELAGDFKKLGNYKQAYAYLKESQQLSDSLKLLKGDLEGLSFARFEVEARERKMIAMQKEVDSLERVNWWWAVSVVLLVAVGIAIMVWLLASRRRQIQELEASKQAAEDQREFVLTELKAKNAALKSYAENLLEKNKEISSLHKILMMASGRQIEPLFDLTPDSVKTMRILTEADWDDFRWRFNQAFPDFLKKLREDLPNFTASDTRFFSLLKLGLSQHQIADVLGISKEGARKANYRLRKKLNIEHDADLIHFVEDFGKSLKQD